MLLNQSMLYQVFQRFLFQLGAVHKIRSTVDGEWGTLKILGLCYGGGGGLGKKKVFTIFLLCCVFFILRSGAYLPYPPPPPRGRSIDLLLISAQFFLVS